MAKKILIVEDEGIIAEDLREVLTLSGYDVVGICATGKAAVELVPSARPDLVSMDIKILGDMDGVDTAREIKRLADIPIIFMTSYNDPATLVRAQAVSSLFVFKPYNERDLRVMFAKALASKKPSK